MILREHTYTDQVVYYERAYLEKWRLQRKNRDGATNLRRATYIHPPKLSLFRIIRQGLRNCHKVTANIEGMYYKPDFTWTRHPAMELRQVFLLWTINTPFFNGIRSTGGSYK